MELSRDDNANVNMIDPNADDFEKVKVHYVCGGRYFINTLTINQFRLWKRQLT